MSQIHFGIKQWWIVLAGWSLPHQLPSPVCIGVYNCLHCNGNMRNACNCLHSNNLLSKVCVGQPIVMSFEQSFDWTRPSAYMRLWGLATVRTGIFWGFSTSHLAHELEFWYCGSFTIMAIKVVSPYWLFGSRKYNEGGKRNHWNNRKMQFSVRSQAVVRGHLGTWPAGEVFTLDES